MMLRQDIELKDFIKRNISLGKEAKHPDYEK